MIDTIKQDSEERMSKTVSVLRSDFQTIRTGKATPSLLDKIQVDYYGTPTPINQLANIAVPEARMLTIQPWDKSALSAIEKAILKSDLGITPNSDGALIRLVLPQLTQDTRKDLVKRVKKKGEEAKVSIRNIRRDSNDTLKASEKSKEITEDESKGAQDSIQKLTDKYIAEVDKLVDNKEKEIMEV
ncbi:MAG: ribosome recycling factor [Peptococcaceae bacterium]